MCTVATTSNGIRKGRAVAQRLDAGFPSLRPGLAYGQHVGFVVDKAALGQVFSEYFSFPCQTFHRFLHYHNHPGHSRCGINKGLIERGSTIDH
jgi:hypothetical protein